MLGATEEEKSPDEKSGRSNTKYELRKNPRKTQRYEPEVHYAAYANVMEEPNSFEEAMKSQKVEK